MLIQCTLSCRCLYWVRVQLSAMYAWRITSMLLFAWKTACFCPATSQTTPCFTAPVRWDSNCLELKQDLPSALLSPFVTGPCSVTSGWEAGKEKNTLEVTCCSHLPAPVIPERSVCLWLRAASHWVLSLPVSHPSPPLPLLIMAEWLLQPCSQAA